jgi:hypothetical protein
MSWFNPITIVFFLALLFLATIAAMYLVSGIRLFAIGNKEANLTKRKSAIITIVISAFCLSILVLQLFNISRFIHWLFF